MHSKFSNRFIRKLLFLFTPAVFILASCEEIPTEQIDNQIESYSVIDVDSPTSFVYSPSDSNVTIHLAVNNSEPIKKVFAEVQSLQANFLLESGIELLDNGNAPEYGDQSENDGIYSGKFSVSKDISNGKYEIQFFIEDQKDTKLVAARKINLYSGQENIAPAISDLQAPDTVIVEAPKSLIELSVKVIDPNGFIGMDVYFTVTNPDETSSGSKIFMYDEGGSGDEVAGDGIYSTIIEVTPTNTKGTYLFDFQAQDNEGAVSNVIPHNIVIE